ncbi:hypothetical protein PR048_001242 [Dryococelus australis]|uniref:HTH CENPB-type domain-containing protein n=1 Tax=Dryococelus australis TaxID=614101 RepID=A0ABQ9IGW3_9NEOP|nr:hypothetical protein PR048_001242 [Dryococelus australis]
MATNRKRRSFTLDVKLKTIDEVDANKKCNIEIARDNIPLSSLLTILKYRDKLLHARDFPVTLSKRKRIRGPKYQKMEDQLLQWYHEIRAANLHVSGPIVHQKADYIALKLGMSDFTFSNDETAAVVVTAESWLESVESILQDYTTNNIFNMDETGILYNLLPNKSLAIN